MNDEILKLAEECGCHPCTIISSTELIYPTKESLEAFYRAAFNAGIEAAAKVCDTRAEIMAMMGGNADPDVLAEQIRNLEMKL